MNTLDKEEFRIKLEEINRLVEKKNYKDAMEVVDSIDWRRVKNVRTLCVVGEIYAANNIEALLKDHKNVTITTSYSLLAEGSDYTPTRQERKDKKGNYFSYFKKEGTDADYKEVIANKELYRYNDKYVQYYGLIGDDYELECVKSIEDSDFQGDTKDQLQNEKERDYTIT